MPMYEYRCPDCAHEFEVIQKFSDDPISVCPKCAAANVKKLISRTNFALKGGGWYSDHYGLKSGGDGAAKGEGAAKSEGAAKGEGASKGEGSGGGESAAPAAAPTAAPSTPAPTAAPKPAASSS